MDRRKKPNKWLFFPLDLKWEVYSKLPMQCPFYLIFHIHRILVCLLSRFSLWAAHPIYCRPYGRWDSEDRLIPWNSMNFAFFCFALFMWPEIKVWGSGRRPAVACSPTEQIACCCADWGLPHTQSMKSVDSRGQGPAWWAQGERNGSVSKPGPLERWKDNSHPPPPLDLMRRQTICEQWQSQIGPKGYEWETSKPAHVSVDVKGFV